jgi:ligand-binding sensor domain-containing protein/signal transduction histidine kinase
LRGLLRLLWPLLAVVCLGAPALALDPNRALSDYIRDRWGAEQGFPGKSVYAIAQTPDGYLWLGTEKGLVRFDGLTFRLFTQTDSAILPAGPILDLLTDGEGNLWIRPQSRNLVRYYQGTFHDAMPELDNRYSGITAMCRGARGEALFTVLATGTFSYSQGRFSRLFSAAEQPNLLIISMAQTSDGKIWMGTRDAGLFYLSQGQMFAVSQALPDKKINRLLAAEDRGLWIGTDNGVMRWHPELPAKAAVPDSLRQLQVLAMSRDLRANLWLGTGKGLFRLKAGGSPALPEADPGSSAAVHTVFEDREGNLWIGSGQGVERLRASPFMTYAFCRDQRSECNGTGYVDAEGRIWFAPSTGGLYWQKDGRTVFVTNDGLPQDVVYSLAGSRGELWIGRQRGGLTRLRFNGARAITESFTRAAGLAQNSIYAVHQNRDGSVWAGGVSGGLSRFKDGRFTTYATANGLASNPVRAILEGADGTMWFGTANGLSALRQERWTHYRSIDGLPSGGVNCLAEDSRGSLWIGTDNGLALLRSGRLQLASVSLQALQEPIRGVAEDHHGGLWISTVNHILRVERDPLQEGSLGEADVREFGLADGLRSVEGVKRHRPVFQDSGERIWFASNRGLSVVDPGQVAGNLVPAMIQIEGITADGNAVALTGEIEIPGARERIIFSYAGLSLSVPERVRFRYRLDGFDQDWSKPVASREAIYTNLAPGSYRFRVIASNSDGFWSPQESSIEFEIQPLFWQTWWFRLSGLMVVGLGLFVLYRLRLHRLTRQLNLRFEERLAERARIAQDLHDTLLQGFLSASMNLHVANDQLPADSPARPLVNRVLELMRQGIEEGRTTLKGLRSSASAIHDLAQAFSGIQEELATQEQLDYRVTVEGAALPLNPIIRDEAYRIGREALVNAFRHARARQIEIILEYAPRQFRLLVRDNGCGMEAGVLHSGREGHWGLPGMRERAEEIGARLRLWSGAGAGTEVELTIPANIAYEFQASAGRRGWLARFSPRNGKPRSLKGAGRGKNRRPPI